MKLLGIALILVGIFALICPFAGFYKLIQRFPFYYLKKNEVMKLEKLHNIMTRTIGATFIILGLLLIVVSMLTI